MKIINNGNENNNDEIMVCENKMKWKIMKWCNN